MNWTRVHLRTFYSRVLRCKLNRTALLYKRTLPLFLYMRQIKTSDELDKSVCAGGWATDLSCSNEQTAELNPSLSDRPSVQIRITPPFHKFVAQKRDDSSSLAIQQQRTEAKRVEVEECLMTIFGAYNAELRRFEADIVVKSPRRSNQNHIPALHPHKPQFWWPLSTLFRFGTFFSQFSQLHQLSSGS